jgi:hypothetical protein
VTRTRAQWVEGIPDLIHQLDVAGSYLNVSQVATATGFAVATITDLLSRPPITSANNPQGPLSRPAARIGNQPLYSHEQVAETKARLAAVSRDHFGGGDTPLPSISPDEAARRGLLSTDEIASLAVTTRTPNGVRDQTVRRWSRDHKDFPPRVALRARRGGRPGVPMVMYNGLKAVSWLINHGYAEGDPKEILARFRQAQTTESVAS